MSLPFYEVRRGGGPITDWTRARERGQERACAHDARIRARDELLRADSLAATSPVARKRRDVLLARWRATYGSDPLSGADETRHRVEGRELHTGAGSRLHGRRGGHRLCAEDRRAVCLAREAGMSDEEISKQLRVNAVAVRRTTSW